SLLTAELPEIQSRREQRGVEEGRVRQAWRPAPPTVLGTTASPRTAGTFSVRGVAWPHAGRGGPFGLMPRRGGDPGRGPGARGGSRAGGGIAPVTRKIAGRVTGAFPLNPGAFPVTRKMSPRVTEVSPVTRKIAGRVTGASPVTRKITPRLPGDSPVTRKMSPRVTGVSFLFTGETSWSRQASVLYTGRRRATGRRSRGILLHTAPGRK